MGVVLLTDNDTTSLLRQGVTSVMMVLVLIATYILLLLSQKIHDKFGDNSIAVLSKIMGLIIASVAVESMLNGIKLYFKL
jgi:multiple antibiotic resistance protein